MVWFAGWGMETVKDREPSDWARAQRAEARKRKKIRRRVTMPRVYGIEGRAVNITLLSSLLSGFAGRAGAAGATEGEEQPALDLLEAGAV